MSEHVVGLSAESILTAQELQPIAGVIIRVGQAADGTPLVYQAPPVPGAGRILEIENPWGTQAIANNVWAQVAGYVHRPYEASNVFLDPSAELGDAVTIGSVKSVLEQQDIDFDPLCTSGIAATGADETENEFGDYATKADRAVMRINTISTTLLVELGHIRADVTDEIQNMHADIDISLEGISMEVSGSYADEWESGTAQHPKNYLVGDIVKVLIMGDGVDEWEISTAYDEGDYCKVTTTSGGTTETHYYRCLAAHTSSSSNEPPDVDFWYEINAPVPHIADVQFYSCTQDHVASVDKRPPTGSNWQSYWTLMQNPPTMSSMIDIQAGRIESKVQSDLDDMEEHFESMIAQAADEIMLDVKGSYADEWTAEDDQHNQKHYYVGDIVKVTDTSGDTTTITYYSCILEHDATVSRKPPNTTYWDKISQPTIESLINLGMNGIGLVYSTTGTNKAFIQLNKEGVQIGGGLIQMSNVRADSLTAYAMSTISLTADQIDTQGLSAWSLVGGNIDITVPAFKGFWQSTGSYSVDDIVRAGNDFYKCIAAHDSSPDTSVRNVQRWQSGQDYEVGAAVYDPDGADEDRTFNCIQAHEASSSTRPGSGSDWQDYWTEYWYYAVDEYGHGGLRYYNDNLRAAKIEATKAQYTDFALDITSYGSMRLYGSEGATYIHGATQIQLDTDSVPGTSVKAPVRSITDIIPGQGSGSTPEFDLGYSNVPWDDVYCVNVVQSSDRELKKDISYCPELYDSFFDGLRPCSYRWKNGHERVHLGLIAQDVEALIEDCGLTTQDVAAFVKSPNPDGGYSYGLRYGELIPLLIYEVQRLKKEVFKNGQ